MDGEVFGVDRLVVADQPQRRLVRMIKACLPHLTVQDRDTMPGPGPVRGTFLPAGQNPLSRPQPLVSLPQEAGVRDYLTVRGDGQAGQPRW